MFRVKACTCRQSFAGAVLHERLSSPVELSRKSPTLLLLDSPHQRSQQQCARSPAPFSAHTNPQLRSLRNVGVVAITCANAFDADLTKRTSHNVGVRRKLGLQAAGQVLVVAPVSVLIKADTVVRCVSGADAPSSRAIGSWVTGAVEVAC